MATIITEYRFLEPFTDEQLSAISRDLDPALARRDASWRRSYASDDRLRLICEFDAKDAETVAAAHREEGVAYEAIWNANRSTIEELEAERAHEQIEPANVADVARP